MRSYNEVADENCGIHVWKCYMDVDGFFHSLPSLPLFPFLSLPSFPFSLLMFIGNHEKFLGNFCMVWNVFQVSVTVRLFYGLTVSLAAKMFRASNGSINAVSGGQA